MKSISFRKNKFLKVGNFRIPVVKVFRGWRGIVIKTRLKGRDYAIKIHKKAKYSYKEAIALKKASRIRAAPRVFRILRKCIFMQFLSGPFFEKYVLEGKNTQKIRKLAIKVLEKALRLDNLKITNLELSRAHKHIILHREEPFFIDFGRVSFGRGRNFEKLMHYLFFNPSSNLAEKLRQIFGLTNEDIEKFKKLLKKKKKETILLYLKSL